MELTRVDISVIVPLYNELANVAELNRRLIQAMDGLGRSFEMIYVDDGSRDGTLDVLEELSSQDPRIKVVGMRENQGQSAALMTGFRFAEGETAVTLDGDLQNPPEEIPRLLEALDSYDVVCGWRKDRKDGFGKKAASRVSNLLARRLTGVDIHDFGCTLRAYKREVIKDLVLYNGWHRYIPALAAWKGYRVDEVVVGHGERRHGETKYGPKRLVEGFIDLMNISYLMGRVPRPGYLFSASGLVLVMSSVWMALGHIKAFLIILGLFLLGMGLLNEKVLKGYEDEGTYGIKAREKSAET